jgi:hypothetical protein
VRLEEDDPAITYSPQPPDDWLHRFPEGASGGQVRASRTAGARATLGFVGTAVWWIGQLADDTGIARVFLDGALVAVVDTYSATPMAQPVLFAAGGLAPGSHVLVIEVTGTSNPASSAAWIAVDAFDVTP